MYIVCSSGIIRLIGQLSVGPVDTSSTQNEDSSCRTHVMRKRDAAFEGSDELGGCDYCCNGCLPRDVLCYEENQDFGCPCDGMGAGQAETGNSRNPRSSADSPSQ